MKRKLSVLLALILIICQMVSATTKGMNIIPLSSPIYEYVDLLYTLEGLAGAQGARPWTEADLRQQIGRITPTSDAAIELYNTIKAYLDEDDKETYSGEWNLSLNPSMAVHSNEKSFNTSDDWNSKVLNDKLLKANFSLYVSDYLAANFGLSLGLQNSANAKGDTLMNEDKTQITGYKFNPSSNEDRFNSIFATNIPFLSKGSFDLDVTDNSFVSLGTPYVSVTIARGELSWGNGAMGNLVLGNTLPYHDYVGIAASNNEWFDYNMVVSFFTHPQNYYQGFTSEINGIQMFIAHRFEFRMFEDKLRLTLNEAIMYHSPDNTVDFRIFNPLLILHGLYIPANANSLVSAELEYAPIKNLQIYLSFATDDFAVGNEPKAPENDATLNMWGITGGIRSTIPYKKGTFSIIFETVYTSPFMYHKDSYNESAEYDYVLDYVGSVRLQNGKFDRQYLSFPFGSDAFAILGGLSYTKPYDWDVGLKLFFMAHGVTNKNSVAEKYDGTQSYVPDWLATKNPWTGEEGEISYTYNVGLNGGYYFLDNLRLESALDFIYVMNFENKADNNQFDVQWTLSLKYSIF